MATDTRKRKVKVTPRVTSGKKPKPPAGFALVPTNSFYKALLTRAVKRLAPAFRERATVVSVPQSGSIGRQADAVDVVVISRLADLTEEVLQRLEGSGRNRQLVFISKFPVEAVTSRLMKLKIRTSDRLHLAGKGSEGSESEVIQRLVTGMAEDDDGETIVDAWIEGEELVLLSPAFERMRIPHSKLVRFLGSGDSEFSRFEIDEDGRFLYWPDSDTHLGWKQLEQLINPAVAIRDKKKNDDFRHRYGQAIRGLREERGLKQTEIDGLTDRQLRRIEQGQQMVTSKALTALAKAHKLEVAEYMNELGRRSATS